MLVNRDISVSQLKNEIAIEEKIDVTQIKVTSTQQALDDKASVYTYPLDGELLSVLGMPVPTNLLLWETDNFLSCVIVQPYVIVITDRGTTTSLSVTPSEPIVQVTTLMDVDPTLVHIDDIQFKWNGEIVDKNCSFISLGIISGSQLELGMYVRECYRSFDNSLTTGYSCTDSIQCAVGPRGPKG